MHCCCKQISDNDLSKNVKTNMLLEYMCYWIVPLDEWQLQNLV